MKITDIKIAKEEFEGGAIGLACRCTLENGEQIEAGSIWRNTNGLWASDSDAREPAEIAATLRSFAKAIDEAGRGSKAA
jgi:hypothetical protein